MIIRKSNNNDDQILHNLTDEPTTFQEHSRIKDGVERCGQFIKLTIKTVNSLDPLLIVDIWLIF